MLGKFVSVTETKTSTNEETYEVCKIHASKKKTIRGVSFDGT